tara:strand:+ start:211935 stop:212336 length:402 start_codon:yes stop_codon:yes gene_type:complete
MSTTKITILIVLAAIGLILSLMFGLPKYNVWQSKVAIETAQNLGKAELIRAQENRKIAIEEAEANKIVQEINSEIEVIRAKGMAEAIEIENGKLTEMYIYYLWVRNIDKMDGDVIYIPTEANLPILEAMNRPK